MPSDPQQDRSSENAPSAKQGRPSAGGGAPQQKSSEPPSPPPATDATISFSGPAPAKAKPAENKSTMQSLGEFFGHVIKGVKTPVPAPRRSASPPSTTPITPITPASSSPPAPPPISTRVEEETRDSSLGRVVLRRTIIEEVVLPPTDLDGKGAQPGTARGGQT